MGNKRFRRNIFDLVSFYQDLKGSHYKISERSGTPWSLRMCSTLIFTQSNLENTNSPPANEMLLWCAASNISRFSIRWISWWIWPNWCHLSTKKIQEDLKTQRGRSIYRSFFIAYPQATRSARSNPAGVVRKSLRSRTLNSKFKIWIILEFVLDSHIRQPIDIFTFVLIWFKFFSLV